MALKPCKECKKEVSDSAKKCPHCGVAYPALVTTKRQSAMAAFILLGLSVAVALSICTGDGGRARPLEQRTIVQGQIFGCRSKEMLKELDALKGQADEASYLHRLSECVGDRRCRKMRVGRQAEIKESDDALQLVLVRQTADGDSEFYWVTSKIF